MVPETLQRFLTRYPRVEFVHYNFVDLAGLFKTRCFPKAQCVELASTGSPATLGCLCTIAFCDASSLPDDLTLSGWDSLYPDWSSLRIIETEHASVMCNISEELSGHKDIDPKEPFLRCPRSTLQQAIAHVYQKCGATFLAGFEIEFYLINVDVAKDPRKFKQPAYKYLNASWSLRGEYAECAYECVRKIQEAGINVNLLHAIRGPQQFQIPIGPFSALECADKLVQAKEIIRRVAVKRDLRAIFLPKPFPDLEPCGLHAHLSLNPELEKINLWNSWENPEDSFMAGILNNLPLITAFGMSNEASYERVEQDIVGNWVSWGTGNRDTPIRRVNKNRWEFRAIDGFANPYLVLAAYIASGCIGILEGRKLEMAEVREPLSSLMADDLEKRCVVTRMPGSFREALEALREHINGEELTSILGPKMMEFFVAVKEGELDTMRLIPDEQKPLMHFEFY